MTEDHIRLSYLFNRYFNKTATAAETDELMLLLQDAGNETRIKALIDEAWKNFNDNDIPYSAEERMEILDNILQPGIIGRKKLLIYQYRFLAAAAVALLIIGSAFFWLHYREKAVQAPANHYADAYLNDVSPGGNKAMLTLSNGVRIVLDSAQNGLLTRQGNTRVMKLDNGELAYHRQPVEDSRTTVIEYNTLSTPRGGQYRLILPDGSKVWLNAASSLHFPTAFTGKEREVEVSGEAYFEIAENASHPFKVHIASPDGKDEGTVQVLGTHFNINAYNDEPFIRTTLLEGAVRMSKGNTTLVLSPGEQAVLDKQGGMNLVKDINANQAVAWKNGFFEFGGSDIQSVMRQIGRWYNVDIKYEGNIPGHFMGTISRDVNVSEVFKMLEIVGKVHFKIEGRSVTVLP